MAREDHQPWTENPKRPERSKDDRQAVCGRGIAFVLALGPQPGDLTKALETACASQAAAVYILAKPEYADKAAKALREVRHSKNQMVEAMEYDLSAAVGMTREAGNFELFSQLSFGLLETMRVVASTLLDDYKFVIAVDSAQENVTADHLYEVCEDALQHPEAEVVVSWIQKLRRMPCVVRREFLERLEVRDPKLLGAGGRPDVAPLIKTRDHLFGEEKLAGESTPSNKVQAFLDKTTLTALEVVSA